MRMIECNICGEPLAAATDDELQRRLLAHVRTDHAAEDMDEDQAGALIDAEAYDASDS